MLNTKKKKILPRRHGDDGCKDRMTSLWRKNEVIPLKIWHKISQNILHIMQLPQLVFLFLYFPQGKKPKTFSFAKVLLSLISQSNKAGRLLSVSAQSLKSLVTRWLGFIFPIGYKCLHKHTDICKYFFKKYFYLYKELRFSFSPKLKIFLKCLP